MAVLGGLHARVQDLDMVIYHDAYNVSHFPDITGRRGVGTYVCHYKRRGRLAPTPALNRCLEISHFFKHTATRRLLTVEYLHLCWDSTVQSHDLLRGQNKEYSSEYYPPNYPPIPSPPRVHGYAACFSCIKLSWRLHW